MPRNRPLSRRAPLCPDAELERIWRVLAQQEQWPGGRCPAEERGSWVYAMADTTEATPQRVERIGVRLGLLPSPAAEDLGDPRERTCAECGVTFSGTRRAVYCGQKCRFRANKRDRLARIRA